MTKRCRGCEQLLDSSSFYHSNQEPDGLQRLRRSCVKKRRRKRCATKRSETGHGSPPRLQDLVKKGDCAAVKKNRSLINAGNREYLLTLAVTDFKTAPKKPSHVELVKFLIQLGAKPDFHLVCAATVGPHIDIMNALIDAGADQNIFTAAALGEVDRVCDLLSTDPTLANKTTTCAYDKDMTALHYACRSEPGKVNRAYADQLFLCAELLLGRRPASGAEFDRAGSPHGFGTDVSRSIL
jgi:hypothetical protein